MQARHFKLGVTAALVAAGLALSACAVYVPGPSYGPGYYDYVQPGYVYGPPAVGYFGFGYEDDGWRHHRHGRWR